MAQIIFKAIDQAKLIPHSQVSFIRRDPGKMKRDEQEFGITSTSLENLVKKSNIILLGVRPNQAHLVLEKLKHLKLDESKIFISIIAGIQLNYYKKFINSPVLRVMPNLASEVAMGMSVFSYGPNTSLEFRSLAHILFSCMGEVMEVPESMMDVSCGIAGSGPGFVFRLIESMARAGEKEGLEYAKALKMAAQTFAGAAKLILKKSHPENLLLQIATPNGTTEAGLRMMHSLQMDEHFQTVISASVKRSKELSEEYQ